MTNSQDIIEEREFDDNQLYNIIQQIQIKKLNKQKEIKNNLTGNLEDVKSKYNSVYYYYLMNFIVVITIISIILYFYFNKDEDVFGTAVALITALIIVYLVAKYIYNHISIVIT